MSHIFSRVKPPFFPIFHGLNPLFFSGKRSPVLLEGRKKRGPNGDAQDAQNDHGEDQVDAPGKARPGWLGEVVATMMLFNGSQWLIMLFNVVYGD